MPTMPGLEHIFGGGPGQTSMGSVALVILLISLVLILVLPRRYMIHPVLAGVLLIPLGQQMHAFGVHWQAARIITLFGLLRLAAVKISSRSTILPGGYTSVDKAFIWCMICQAVAFILLYQQSDAVVNQFGFLIDYIGGYLLVRAVIQDDMDTYRVLKFLAILTAIVALCMLVERATLQNPFGFIAGTEISPAIRNGKVRGQGSFQHALTAGTFAATLLPLFLMLWWSRVAKIAAVTGVIACTAMTVFSNSSTPLLAYVAGLFAICLWPARKHMRLLRAGFIAGLVALHFLMKAPVWFLIARIDLTGGSSGYHRALLIDQCISRFNEWWLLGKGFTDWGWDMWDTQNQFVTVATQGGLLPLILFILVFYHSFADIGNSRRKTRTRKQEWHFWLIGSALFAHITAFFGVNYFDQSRFGLFLILAIVSAASAPVLRTETAKSLKADEVETGDNLWSSANSIEQYSS